MISLRIPPELEKKLTSLARTQGKSKSEIIKKSLLEYFSRHEQRISPYELGKDLFGTERSGRTDLSSNRKEYLKQKLEQKHEKRSSD